MKRCNPDFFKGLMVGHVHGAYMSAHDGMRLVAERDAWKEMAEAEAAYSADPDSPFAQERWKQASADIADLDTQPKEADSHE